MLRFDSGVIARHQLTNDGYLRTYMRIAKADHELVYRNPLGDKRVEVISEQELFNTDSLDSFVMLPITDEHPPVQVSSQNFRQYGRGSSGQTLIREVTPIGTFLGTIATVYDSELANSITSGERFGVSPGYRVKTRDRKDGKLDQFDRRGNHIAAVRNPRGGIDIKTVLEGLRVDSDEELDLWVQDVDTGIYRADVGDWILPLLEGRNVTGVAQKKAIVLNKAEDDTEKDLHEDDCECESCHSEKKPKRRARAKRTDSMEVTTIEINGTPLEMPVSHAAIIQSALLNRTDSVNDELSELRQDNDDLIEQNSALETENEELREMLGQFVELYETDSADDDSDEEYEEEEDDEEYEDEDDPLSFNSVESLSEFVADSVDHYLTLASDAQLVGLEFGDNRKDAIEACLIQTEAVQRQILATANSGFNTDSYEGETLDAVYEVAMQSVRAAAKSAQRSDSIDFVSPLKAIGSLTTATPQTGGGMAAYYAAQDAAFIGNKS